MRADETFTLTVDGDSWLVIEVTGTGSLWPVDGSKPYTLTNPIYVDLDGNGQFDPPLPKYREIGS